MVWYVFNMLSTVHTTDWNIRFNVLKNWDNNNPIVDFFAQSGATILWVVWKSAGRPVSRGSFARPRKLSWNLSPRRFIFLARLTSPWVSEDDWNLKKIIYFWLMIRLLLTAVNSTHLQLHAIREAFRVVCHYILQGDFVIVSNLWSTATLALRAILLIEVHVKWYIGQLPIPSDTVPVCSQIKKHSNITCLFLLSIGLTSKYSSTQSACLFVV